MSDSHSESMGGAGGHGTPHEAASRKSSTRRLTLLTIIMVGFAILTWGPSLFSRNMQLIFIPAWLSLTIATVIISMWFAKHLLEAERYRDTEAAPQAAPAHPH